MMIWTAKGIIESSGWYPYSLFSAFCFSPMVSASPKYLTLMRLSAGMSLTMTMLFHWHHSESGMRTILTMRVNKRIVSHQLWVNA